MDPIASLFSKDQILIPIRPQLLGMIHDGPAPTPEPVKGTIKFTFFDDLADLGETYQYEGWVVVDGVPKSTGTFSATAKEQSFQILKTDLDAATDFVISIEPKNDPDPAPSVTKVVKGTFEGNTATINSFEVVGDFETSANVSGEFIIGAPANNTSAVEANSAIWFETSTGAVGLKLPELAEGWVYEGWVVVKDNVDRLLPLSTGTFVDPSMNDNSSFYSGDVGANFPGEYFFEEPGLVDLPIEFPLDLRAAGVVISIEPADDLESTVPFFLKPLVATAPQDTTESTTMDFIKSTFPEGRAVKE